MSVETIDRAAIEVKGDVFAMPNPARHHNIMAIMVNVFDYKPPVKGIEGFLTSRGRFVSRKEAGIIALRSGQAYRMKTPPFLCCDDVWR
jgi:hypothetical protein